MTLLTVLGIAAMATEARAQDDELKCSGIWYDSTSCACQEEEGKRCACAECTGGAECPCLDVLRKDTGTIEGKAKNIQFRRIEGALFLREVKCGKFALPRKNPVMDQKNLVYTPHLLAVMIGTTVDFPNSDTVRHNVVTAEKSSTEFNLGTYDAGEVKGVLLDKVGVTHLLCNVHAEMSAYVIVCQNPYFCVTNKDGTFEIRNVPAGSYKLALFHEKLGMEDIDVTVEAGKTTELELTEFTKK